jgi:phosphatidylcholine synthase
MPSLAPAGDYTAKVGRRGGEATGLTETRNSSARSAFRRLAAWSVHLLTASGAVWGLLALVAAAEGDVKTALVWMAVALLVDSLDGVLARRVRTDLAVPEIDGALLDNLVDYLNYVIVPAYLVQRTALLPAGLGPAGAGLICLASAFQFSHVTAKTSDHFFRGFPSCWNFVVFYLLILRPRPWITLGLLAALALLAVSPARFVYPSRTPRLRRLTLALAALWGLALVVLLVQYPRPRPELVWGSLSFVAYYVALSTVLALRRGG